MFFKNSYSAQETEQLGISFAKYVTGKEVVALFGDMGMGKTVFVKGFCKALDSKEEVSSPTFALVHEYKGKYPVYHFDMYRVTSWDDLYSTGFFDYLDIGIIIVEWSENIEEALPDNTIKIHFSRGESENERTLEFEGVNSF